MREGGPGFGKMRRRDLASGDFSHPKGKLPRKRTWLLNRGKQGLRKLMVPYFKGLPFSKPEVISLLQQGDDPWKVEKESPGGSSV
eukprot:bmy_03337T0